MVFIFPQKYSWWSSPWPVIQVVIRQQLSSPGNKIKGKIMYCFPICGHSRLFCNYSKRSNSSALKKVRCIISDFCCSIWQQMTHVLPLNRAVCSIHCICCLIRYVLYCLLSWQFIHVHSMYSTCMLQPIWIDDCMKLRKSTVCPLFCTIALQTSRSVPVLKHM